MWTKVYEIIKDLFLLQRDTQQNKDEIKEVRSEIKDVRREIAEIRDEFSQLVLLVERLSFEIHRVSEREKHEREMISLRLENEMLKFERRLPSGKNE